MTRSGFLIAACVLICACASPRAPVFPAADAPPQWQTSATSQPVLANWLESFDAPYLNAVAEDAVTNNLQLAQLAAQVDIAQQQIVISGAQRWPALSVGLGGQRSRATVGGTTELVDVSAVLSFEIDLWGKLSDQQRQAQLNYAAEQMRYLDAENRLVAQTVNTSFDVLSARQLSDLFEQRLDNLAQGLDVIEKGYRSGLNEALDVYLAQNTFQQERANVANQRQVSFQAATDLQRLVAHYPSAQLDIELDDLPSLSPLPNVGVPAELLNRRPDIQQVWLELLAADANLAVAHKNRFVSLDLSASVRDADSAVSRLLDGGQLGFSVAASLFQPVFQGGRLKSLEEQAMLQVLAAEKNYLDTVYTAMAEVENELQRGVTLRERLDAFEKAQENASTALNLAFDQYQRGLVSFTIVLESQRRAYDAQTTVVQLRNQLLKSRVALLLALGGNY